MGFRRHTKARIKARNHTRVYLCLFGLFLFMFFISVYALPTTKAAPVNLTVTVVAAPAEPAPEPEPAPPAGGGGGGGITIAPTSVIFSGRAYPLSKVIVLKDGQRVISTIAGPDARFKISLSGLASGDYTFFVLGEDSEGRQSTPFTFPVFITHGVTTLVSGIFLAPTIDVDKSEVKRGDAIAIFGQSVPEGEVSIFVNSHQEFFESVRADNNGVYLFNFDTALLHMGNHITKSKTVSNGEISPFGKAMGFVVGTRNIAKVAIEPLFRKGDLNGDGRVNLIDFSITAFWYKRPLPPETVDLNGDGKVDLIDFSIMAFHWTG